MYEEEPRSPLSKIATVLYDHSSTGPMRAAARGEVWVGGWVGEGGLTHNARTLISLVSRA